MAARTRQPSLRTRLNNSDDVFFRMLGGCLSRWVLLGLLVVVLFFAVANRDSIGATFWQHVGQYCGTLDYSPGGQNDFEAVAKITSCFTHAYATCQAASLDFSIFFGDGGTVYEFIVEPPPLGFGGCNLVLQETTHLASGGLTHRSVVSCGGLVNDNGRLRFWSCGDVGDIWGPTP